MARKRHLRRRRLSIEEILRWAKAHRELTGKWPTKNSGPVVGATFEKWSAINQAMIKGVRGLDGGITLAKLLEKECGVRNIQNLPRLTYAKILKWADEHHERTRKWPTPKSGIIPNSGGEKWQAIQVALHLGARKLPGGSSIALLLKEHRGVRSQNHLEPLTEEIILAWADSHFKRTGNWPTRTSGEVADAPGETWSAINSALHNGRRKLPGKSSLALLLAERRQASNIWTKTNFTIKQILAWADAFYSREKRWPSLKSGTILESPGNTWLAVDNALANGLRGLTGGSTLAKLLAQKRGARKKRHLPRLSHKLVLKWADAFHKRSGNWPNTKSGPIIGATGETWGGIASAMSRGTRGFKTRTSLARLLQQHRDYRNVNNPPRLSRKRILAWADAYFQRTGKWPNKNSGVVPEAPNETWRNIDNSLRMQQRGLTGKSSLLKLLQHKKGARNKYDPPPITVEEIAKLAKRHFEKTGSWPKSDSGPVIGAPGETWSGIENALRRGRRKLPAGLSVAKLVKSMATGTSF